MLLWQPNPPPPSPGVHRGHAQRSPTVEGLATLQNHHIDQVTELWGVALREQQEVRAEEHAVRQHTAAATHARDVHLSTRHMPIQTHPYFCRTEQASLQYRQIN